jgi:hypothetical protein
MTNLLLYGYVIFGLLGIRPSITDSDGLYLPIDEQSCDFKELQFKNKAYCIPEKPLISVYHFKKIGMLKSAGKIDFFDVDIDKAGTKKLFLLQENLKGLDLAFILNDQIIGMIELDDNNSSHQMRFYSIGFDTPLKEVHDQLEEILESKKD